MGAGGEAWFLIGVGLALPVGLYVSLMMWPFSATDDCSLVVGVMGESARARPWSPLVAGEALFQELSVFLLKTGRILSPELPELLELVRKPPLPPRYPPLPPRALRCGLPRPRFMLLAFGQSKDLLLFVLVSELCSLCARAG